MRPREPVELARAAYLRAVRHARTRSSPAAWRRLVTAARNLSRAIAADSGRQEPAGDRPPGPPVVPLRAIPYSGARDPWLFAPDADPSAGSPRCWRMERCPELTVEWERSRAIMERSRRLVDRSRALCAELAAELDHAADALVRARRCPR